MKPTLELDLNIKSDSSLTWDDGHTWDSGLFWDSDAPSVSNIELTPTPFKVILETLIPKVVIQL